MSKKKDLHLRGGGIIPEIWIW